MNLLFISAASRWRSKARRAESAYKVAIKENMEFSEIKKLYVEFKRLEKEHQRIKDRKIEEKMGISLL